MARSWSAPNLLARGAGLALSSAAWGHDHGPLTEYLRWPLPDPVGLGAAGFATFIGPPEGYEITHARMHIVFITDTRVDPQEVGVTLSSQVDRTFRDWPLHLADTGISGEPGRHVADVETDLLNGVVWEYRGWPHSFLDFEWFTAGAHPNTYFSGESWFEVQLEPVPAPGVASLAGAAAMLAAARRRRR